MCVFRMSNGRIEGHSLSAFFTIRHYYILTTLCPLRHTRDSSVKMSIPFSETKYLTEIPTCVSAWALSAGVL